MRLKGITYEDYTQYKKPSMFLSTCFCDFKCEKENPGCDCQNHPAYNNPIRECDNRELVERYMGNPLTKAIVIGGFEPLLQWTELFDLIKAFRKRTKDDIVIYTGYNLNEIPDRVILVLKKVENIILKVGRYIPNQQKHRDMVLGVELASPNQYAIRL